VRASQFEAQKLHRKTRGLAIGIGPREELESFWRRLDETTKGKQIGKLFIFGHGSFDVMHIGAGELKPGFEVPVAFQSCRFARKAEIRFFGCHAGRGFLPWAPESLLTEVEDHCCVAAAPLPASRHLSRASAAAAEA
jgi:hypothetical protein